MRKVLLTVFLVSCGSVLAQLQYTSPPDAATCARVVVPQARPMPPALTAAVRETLRAYQMQAERLTRAIASRPPTPLERRQREALSREAFPYLRRLLGTYGWPTDPALRATLAPLLDEPEVQWCAGQVALKAATTQGERQQAANLIDRGLIGVGARQRYGTMYNVAGGTVRPLPTEDAANVDTRRAAAGLPPLAEDPGRVPANLPPRQASAGLKRRVALNSVCKAFTNEAALNTLLTAAQLDTLAEEAAFLVEQDQASALGQPGARDWAVVNAESTAWLKSVLRRYGWTSTNRSDPQLSFNAWLLAQHADATLPLQACILDLIRQQRSTQAEAQNFAYLTDRVRLAQGESQVYGTQVTYDDVQGRATPRMLVNPAHVNERRAAVGLGAIEDYLKVFERPR